MRPVLGHHSKMSPIIYRDIVMSGVFIEKVGSRRGWKRNAYLNWRDFGSSWLFPNQFANGLSKDERMNTVARAISSQK